MKSNLTCLTLCLLLLAACGPGENSAANAGGGGNTAANSPDKAKPELTHDVAEAEEVVRKMLEAAQAGDAVAAKKFLTAKEQASEATGIKININEKQNMKSFEIVGSRMEGESAIVTSHLTYSDDTKPHDMEFVTKKEEGEWRVDFTDTITRGLKNKNPFKKD